MKRIKALFEWLFSATPRDEHDCVLCVRRHVYIPQNPAENCEAIGKQSAPEHVEGSSHEEIGPFDHSTEDGNTQKTRETY